MKSFFKSNQVVGINFGINDLSMMAFTPNKKTAKVTSFSAIKLDSSRSRSSLETEDGYLEEQIAKLMKRKQGKITSNYSCISVPSGKTFSKTLQIPSEAQKEMKQLIDLEIEQYIPIPKDLLVYDYQVINQVDDKINIILSAVPKQTIERVASASRSVGLEPILIEPSMNSIARLLTAYEEATVNTLIIDIGIDYTDIAILNKVIRITNSVPFGGNYFTDTISKELNVSIEKAHQLKVLKGFTKSPQQKEITKALEKALSLIITEIKKIIRYNDNRLGGEPIEQILVMGISSNIAGLGEWLTNQLTMPVRLANPWKNFDFKNTGHPSKNTIARYLTVAGMSNLDPKEVIND